jgi:hypothetical protein
VLGGGGEHLGNTLTSGRTLAVHPVRSASVESRTTCLRTWTCGAADTPPLERLLDFTILHPIAHSYQVPKQCPTPKRM